MTEGKPPTLGALAAAVGISLVLVAVLGGVFLWTTQAEAPSASSCQDAMNWHLRASMNATNPDQEYHLNAARAARSLADAGQDCNAWQDDRGA